LGKQPGQVAWASSLGKQPGQVAWASSLGKQPGQASLGKLPKQARVLNVKRGRILDARRE
ncbi:MAG TPA: hypothetical protein VLE70_18050, partial [Anaerolineae bacterium]|nr:hypothetical protein [Anaerolineae bacterium]